MDVDLSHVADMGDDRQPVRVGRVGDLDIFGDAAEPGHVGLHVVNGAGVDEAR